MLLNYLIGPAGSGKTTLTQEVFNYITDYNDQLDIIIVNLDPGVKYLPYKPDIDVREYVNIDDIMKNEGYGPNGAMIEATNRLKDIVEELKYEIDQYNDPDFVFVDTPGQMELFAFREIGPLLASSLGFTGTQRIITFLFDPMMCKRPSGFLSTMFLAAAVQFRFINLPVFHVLTKIDTLQHEQLEHILNWVEDPYLLENDIMHYERGMIKEMNLSMVQMFPDLATMSRLTPVSAHTHQGIDLYFGRIQQIANNEDSPYV